MARVLWTLFLIAGIAGLVYLKQDREPDPRPVDVGPTPPVEPDEDPDKPIEGVTLTLEWSRAGVGHATVTWLDAAGGELAGRELDGPLSSLEFVEGTETLRIAAPGHRTMEIPWPDVGHRHVKLEARGADEDLFTEKRDRPDTTGPVDCPLRLIDARTNRLVSGVSIRLDGTEVAVSSAVGEASVAFARLTGATRMSLHRDGYRTLEFDLTPGRIDELQVEALRLEPK